MQHPPINAISAEDQSLMSIDSWFSGKRKNQWLLPCGCWFSFWIILSLKPWSAYQILLKENSAKPWNRYGHFTAFIKPKKNMSLCLKDHRFNRLGDCAVTLLYHLDDITSYLDKFSNIVNGITVLDRSFVEMEILKPIFAAIGFIGKLWKWISL